MKIEYGRPGSYWCRSCGIVLGEPFFCANAIQRLAAAMAYVGAAIVNRWWKREVV